MHYLYPTTWLDVAGAIQGAGGSALWWTLMVLGLLVTGFVYHWQHESGNKDAPFSIIVGGIMSFIAAWAWPFGMLVLCVILWAAAFVLIALIPAFVMRRVTAMRFEREARKKIRESLDNQ